MTEGNFVVLFDTSWQFLIFRLYRLHSIIQIWLPSIAFWQKNAYNLYG